MSQKVYIEAQEVQTLISKMYPLRVQAIDLVRGVCRIKTDRGDFAFKNAEELPDLLDIKRSVEAIHRQGFTRLPLIVPSRSGETLIEHAGVRYYVEQWIAATEVNRRKVPFDRLGATLAEFHRAAEGIVPPPSSIRYGLLIRPRLLQRCAKYIKEWRHNGFRSHYAGYMLEFLDYRCRLASDYLEGATDSQRIKSLPKFAVMCHGSLHHKNILVDNEDAIWFIDLESFVYAERALDIAGMLHYFAPMNEWDPVSVQALIASYEQVSGATLVREDWRWILSYLAFPRRMVNSMYRYFSNPIKEEKAFYKLKKVIDEDWPKEKIFSASPPGAI